jgi:hypothetical protein
MRAQLGQRVAERPERRSEEQTSFERRAHRGRVRRPRADGDQRRDGDLHHAESRSTPRSFRARPATICAPTVPVIVEGMSRAPQLCLLDTGALHNRFGAWVADAAGIDLASVEEARLALGGFTTLARCARVQLTLANLTWKAPVWFCDPWPLAFHLLGQEGFFRWFDVRMRGALYEITITPEA